MGHSLSTNRMESRKMLFQHISWKDKLESRNQGSRRGYVSALHPHPSPIPIESNYEIVIRILLSHSWIKSRGFFLEFFCSNEINGQETQPCCIQVQNNTMMVKENYIFLLIFHFILLSLSLLEL
jgi:hypothetical protein